MGAATGSGKDSGEEEQFNRTRDLLRDLLDTSPHEAVALARELPQMDANWLLLRATILCDGGFAIADTSAVDEAIEIFDKFLPLDTALPYNLANALARRAQLDKPYGLDWYLRTATIRSRARALNWIAANQLEDEDPQFASQVMTNLGNALDAAHRWLEAFECYEQALRLYPRNGVASGNAARALFRVAQNDTFEHQPHLFDIALQFAQHCKENLDVVAVFAGPHAVATYQELPSERKEEPGSTREKRPDPSDYEMFVAEHRLFLAPILHGFAHDLRRWDDAYIRSIIEPIGTGPEPPPVIAMFNVMKADYLVARELLYQSLASDPSARETGLYMDTLDYATYGQDTSRLVLAQRAALDILDKIAVALNEHFKLGLKKRDVSFVKIWRKKPGTADWHPGLRKVLNRGDPALLALSEVAADLSSQATHDEPPLLSAEREARHRGTHRFTVLHDLGVGGHRPSDTIDHLELHTFQKTALRTLKLARAALLYFVEAIYYDTEARKQEGGLTVPMRIYPHHYIRGEDG